MKGFKIYQIDTAAGSVPAYSRRDFYTICLLTGPRRVQCADQEIELNGTCLFIGNPPGVAAAQWEATRQTGYACRFTEEFFKEDGQGMNQAQWSLLAGAAPRGFSLRAEQAAYLTNLFQKMLAEHQTAYLFKHDLIRTYLQLIMHEALRLPAPRRSFRYYFRQPGPAGELGSGWRNRQRRPG